MANKQIVATIVLTAGLPGRIDVANRIVAAFGVDDPPAHYTFEPAEEDRQMPIPEEDWPIHIVRVGFSSASEISVTRRKDEVVRNPNKHAEGGH